jgi:putative peptidoglycan binding protein
MTTDRGSKAPTDKPTGPTGKPETARERLRQSMVDGVAGLADEHFRHSMANFSRRLGERAADQPPHDPRMAAAERRAALKAYDEARVRRWKTALKATGTVAATLAVTWIVVLIGTPAAPPLSTEPMSPSRMASIVPVPSPSPALPAPPAAAPVDPPAAAVPAPAPAPEPVPEQAPAPSALPVDTASAPDRASDAALVEAAASAAALGPADVKEVQTRLRALGFNPGPIDGHLGRTTQAAIMRYQQDRALPATGKVDEALLEQLRQDPAPQLVAQRPPRPGPRATMAPPRRADPFDDVRAAGNRLGRWLDSLAR